MMTGNAQLCALTNLVNQQTEKPLHGLFETSKVDVLKLNIELDTSPNP